MRSGRETSTLIDATISSKFDFINRGFAQHQQLLRLGRFIWVRLVIHVLT